MIDLEVSVTSQRHGIPSESEEPATTRRIRISAVGSSCVGQAEENLDGSNDHYTVGVHRCVCFR